MSGSKLIVRDRRAAALLATAKPGDIVITPKLDHMFRSARSRRLSTCCAKFKYGGVSLLMIDLGGDTTGNGVSKLVFANPSAVAKLGGSASQRAQALNATR